MLLLCTFMCCLSLLRISLGWVVLSTVWALFVSQHLSLSRRSRIVGVDLLREKNIVD